MPLFVRIDDRLIHGQVVEGWVNFLRATTIFVADDAVASNTLQRSIMEMSVPQGLKVLIGRVDEICSLVQGAGLDAERAMLLFSSPADVARALKSGLECRRVNIGGMRYVAGKRKLLDVLAVDDPDIIAFKELAERGVEIAVQTVPTQRPIPLGDLLDACDISG